MPIRESPLTQSVRGLLGGLGFLPPLEVSVNSITNPNYWRTAGKCPRRPVDHGLGVPGGRYPGSMRS